MNPSTSEPSRETRQRVNTGTNHACMMAFCPNCGNQVPESISFCPRCGFNLKSVSLSPAQPFSPAPAAAPQSAKSSHTVRNVAVIVSAVALMALAITLSGTIVALGGGGTHPTLSISISQSGTTLLWSIRGLTANGGFTVREVTSQGFSDSFGYTASPNGTDSRVFKYGGGAPGDIIVLTVTDLGTGSHASTSYSLQSA